MNIEYTLDRNEKDLEVTVEFDYQPPCRGSRDSMGVPLEPDDEEEIEITAVTDEHGNDIDLTSDEESDIEEKCLLNMYDERN